MLIATQLTKQKDSSFWNVSEPLAYEKCIHYDDAEAIDSAKSCEEAGATNHLYIKTAKETTYVYPTSEKGELLSSNPLFTVCRRESWQYNNHSEIIQMLFDNQQVKYMDAQCDFDNWHSHEHF